MAVILILRFVVLADRSPAVVTASESVPMAEKRLERLRQIAATVPGKEALMKQAAGELESREKGMLKAETGAQAQAQLQELLHQVGAANGIDIRGVEDSAHQAFGQRLRRGFGDGALHLPDRATGEPAGGAGQRAGAALHQPDPGQRQHRQEQSDPGAADSLGRGVEETGPGRNRGRVVNRKLVLLNAVLATGRGVMAACSCATSTRRRKRAKRRCAAARIKPVPAPPFIPLPNDPPVLPSGYKDVAMKTCSILRATPTCRWNCRLRRRRHRPCRNCRAYHGQMNLGDGPMALLVEKPGHAGKSD